jgi:hypothetical protein
MQSAYIFGPPRPSLINGPTHGALSSMRALCFGYVPLREHLNCACKKFQERKLNSKETIKHLAVISHGR